MIRNDMLNRLLGGIESETKSRSTDFGCMTPLYIYRMWGGVVSLYDIDKGIAVLKSGFDC